MKSHALSIAAVTLALIAVAPRPALSAPAPVVFFDIAGPDMAKQAAFYRAVLGWEVAPAGAVSVPVAAPLGGTLRRDPAAAVIYFGVEDVTATLAKVTANGGQVVAPRFEVKSVVILGLFKDPAGNTLGLVETKDGKPKVP